MLTHYQKALNSIQAETLYVVATPIGNLADITLRALAVLQQADLICAEDTRMTVQLLSAYGIQSKLLSVREHNEQHMVDKVVSALANGQIVAQVSDAGTPAVCDPGGRLVAGVRKAGFKVVPVVGASALMAVLSVAEIKEADFYFFGFLPHKSGERQKLFQQWIDRSEPILMFETPHRILSTLEDMLLLFPERRLLLAREVTKTFETFLIGTVLDIQAALLADSNQVRGEMVLVLYPNENQINLEKISVQMETLMRVLSAQLPTKQAVELGAKITGVSKKVLYDLALTWKKG